MTVRRRAALAAAVGIVAATGMGPLPASAHGAPTGPTSRTFACSPEGGSAGTPACQAALAANGRPLGAFDNLRVPGVNGQDRQFIPDGQLCSASLPEFRGLDLPRADWPATSLTAGDRLAVRYATTIAHKGVFKVYATRPGWDPTKPLRWDDLDATPFLTVTDPPVRDGAYTLTGSVPADRTGRHLLYTIWQTTDTPDTYYSCSDVVLTAAGAAAGQPQRPAAPAAPAPRPSAAGPEAGPGAGPAADPTPTRGPASAPASARAGALPPPPPTDGAAPPAERQSWLGGPQQVITDRVALGQQIMSAALIVIVGVTAGLAYLRIRSARPQGAHRRPENR
jgi:chitin-binding protein